MDNLDLLKAGWKYIYENTPGLKPELGNIILDDPRFSVWSASGRKGVHHYGRGGLLKHTSEVLNLMLSTRETLSLNTSHHLIFLSALWHDYGKLWDYSPIGDNKIRVGDSLEPAYDEWENVSHKYEIHHISRSVIEFTKAAYVYLLPQDDIDAITHAILAHHGKKEWGSPVEPRSELAWLLHLSDHMSARLNDWNTINDVSYRV